MIFKMALRNIFRQKRRTLLTFLMMLGGYVLLSFTIAFIGGAYGDMISLFTSQSTGHAQIHNEKYIDSDSIHDGIKNRQPILQKLKNMEKVKGYSPRLKSGALAFYGSKTIGVQVMGIDWNLEPTVTTIKKRLDKGQWPSQTNNNQVLIGSKISETLKVNVGDELVLISQGADGSVANDIFFIKGIFQKEDQGVDDYRIYMDLPSAQMFYSTSLIHEIAIKLNNIGEAKNFSKNFNLPDGLIIRPWQEVEKEFYRAMEADKKGHVISYSIVMVVVALGVLNTVLMSILERSREFGILKAIGTSPLSLSFLIVLEAQLIAIISILIGIIFATLINGYFTIYGLSYGDEPMTFGGVTISTMYSEISLISFIEPALIVMGSTLFVSIFPALKAAHTSPIDALREN